jgi:NAD(P)H-dependent FMN reductase
MTKPRIAIIVGSTRETRFADKPAQWIRDLAARRGDLEVEIVDLRDHPLPFFDETRSPAYGAPESPEGRRWGETIARFDGYIFVTPEYNRSIPAVLKNALDYAYHEWNRKPAAFLGYGPVGATRAVEQLRLMAVELQMAPTRAGIHIQMDPYLAVAKGEKALADFEHLEKGARTTLDELAWWAKALKAAREQDQARAAA